MLAARVLTALIDGERQGSAPFARAASRPARGDLRPLLAASRAASHLVGLDWFVRSLAGFNPGNN